MRWPIVLLFVALASATWYTMSRQPFFGGDYTTVDRIGYLLIGVSWLVQAFGIVAALRARWGATRALALTAGVGDVLAASLMQNLILGILVAALAGGATYLAARQLREGLASKP